MRTTGLFTVFGLSCFCIGLLVGSPRVSAPGGDATDRWFFSFVTSTASGKVEIKWWALEAKHIPRTVGGGFDFEKWAALAMLEFRKIDPEIVGIAILSCSKVP